MNLLSDSPLARLRTAGADGELDLQAPSYRRFTRNPSFAGSGFWPIGGGLSDTFSVRAMSSDGHFRAHGRRQVDLTASVQRPPVEGAERIRIVNLSLAGACIESSESL